LCLNFQNKIRNEIGVDNTKEREKFGPKFDGSFGFFKIREVEFDVKIGSIILNNAGLLLYCEATIAKIAAAFATENL
jgi:hypothetical protein